MSHRPVNEVRIVIRLRQPISRPVCIGSGNCGILYARDSEMADKAVAAINHHCRTGGWPADCIHILFLDLPLMEGYL